MTMRARLSRLFTIKTRFEAFLVIYAIALGAAERARHYLETYPGTGGYLLALACSGVVFIAGAKILDAVKRDQQVATPSQAVPRRVRHGRRVTISRILPRSRPMRRGGESPTSLHTN